MVREGTTTVLSMQNNYRGPTEDFAMVVPVPIVLEEENVKVLSDDLFTKIDALGAPRLVEYWEQDPCPPEIDYDDYAEGGAEPTGAMPKDLAEELPSPDDDLGVTIEAEFDVGEYNVVILSAKESNGLEKWLELNKYNIPKGAAGVLKGYIEQGLFFFVAKVDVEKVSFDSESGQATLSPLRFHYDSKDFSLPVRLGLLNADGAQDLIVNVLAMNQRYEATNLKNVTIPTNLLVDKSVQKDFAQFYVSLFDYVLQDYPGAVVTEYAWQAMSCDPCPDGSFGSGGLTGALTPGDLMTLGADVLSAPPAWNSWVLTRLHARYTAEQLKEDLVFQEAKPIIGGRGTPTGWPAKVAEEGAKESSFNNFQGRYITLHPWEGKMECKEPQRGTWGGPPSGPPSKVQPAQNTAFAKRGGIILADAIDPASHAMIPLKPEDAAKATKKKDAGDKPATEGTDAPKPGEEKTPKEAKKSRCSVASIDAQTETPGSLAWVALIGALGFVVARRRRA